MADQPASTAQIAAASAATPAGTAAADGTTLDADAAPALDEATTLACDLATGAVVDPTAVGISVLGAWRDLNCKGNGSESYRRALSPGGSWRFAASSRLPRGTYLASDRRARERGDAYAGDLLADFTRRLNGGKSSGEAVHDGQIGLVIGPAADGDGADIAWMDAVRQKDGTVRVVLPTGAHLTVPSPGWRS